MTQKIQHAFYNYSRLLSFNAVYNFLVGPRGNGKTYGAKKRAIRKAIKNGEQFIYLRRYKPELGASRRTFFADIEHEFPQFDFRIHGNEAHMSHISSRSDKKREWATIGFFIALSTAQSQKSVSFPHVTTIIFDEFIIEKGHTRYLPDEVIAFNNFYSTVDRNQDKTKVFFLANSVSIMNPYFMTYEIRPDETGEMVVKYDGFVVCHFAQSSEFKDSVYQTRFGKFIKGTDYADYAVDNTFKDNNDRMLNLKNYRAKYQFTLETSNGTFSIWIDFQADQYFVQTNLPSNQTIYTLMPDRMDDDKTLLTFSDKPLGYLRTAFRHGRVSFDKPTTRNAFIEIFKR